MSVNYNDFTSSHQTRMNARKTPLCAVRAPTVRTLQESTFVRVRESLKLAVRSNGTFLIRAVSSSPSQHATWPVNQPVLVLELKIVPSVKQGT